MTRKIVYIFAVLMILTACAAVFSASAFAKTAPSRIVLTSNEGIYQIPNYKDTRWHALIRLSSESVQGACYHGTAADVIDLLDSMVMFTGAKVMDYQRSREKNGRKDVVVVKMLVKNTRHKVQLTEMAILPCR